MDLFADQNQLNFTKGKKFNFNKKDKKKTTFRNTNNESLLSKTFINNNKDTLLLQIKITMGNHSKKETSIKLPPKTLVAEIIHDLISKKIINKQDAEECTIMFGKQVLNKFNYLEDYKEIGNSSTIQVNLKPINVIDSILPPKEMVPKIDQRMKIYPDINDLSKMTEYQLSKVPNVVIENEFGKIEFINPVDLREVDVSKDIVIQKNKISIYSQY